MSLVKINHNIYPADFAITALQHSRGLMEQKDPPIMAFLFSKAEERSFWMHRTPHPLWICFCRKGRVESIELGIPHSEEHLTGRADMVVEVPVGRLKVAVGDKIIPILSALHYEAWATEYLL